MRFRIGNEWIEAVDGKPIMVFLEPIDRIIITTMDPFSNIYATFSNNDDKSITNEEKIAWMTTETIKVKPFVPPEMTAEELRDAIHRTEPRG